MDQKIADRKAALNDDMAALVDQVQEGSYTTENLRALQALADRRFDPAALPVRVVAPAQWPHIDVSVAPHGNPDHVVAFTASLLAQHYPLSHLHLYVTDTGSNDATAQALKAALAPHQAKFASVSFIRQRRTRFGSLHRSAIRAGSSEWCLVIDTRLAFAGDAIQNVVATALGDPAQTASWELRQVPHRQPPHYDPVTLETNCSSHACILLRRSAYEAVGGYDPRVFAAAHGAELSYRLRSFGYVLKYVPRATMHNNAYVSDHTPSHEQTANSAFGNLYVRMRYGSEPDRRAASVLYGVLLNMPLHYPGVRRQLLVDGLRLLRHGRYPSRQRGPVLAHFPFRVFDYEMSREGVCLPMAPAAPDSAPLVSVVTRSYHGRDSFLSQAMQSVFNQTYPAIELIVVQDGGDSLQTPVTQAALRAPPGCEVRFLAAPKVGRSAAGNIGLAAATGRYLMFLDDDDLLYADHIETLAGTLTGNTQLAAAYALATEVLTETLDNGRYLETAFQIPERFYQDWSHEVLMRHNFIPIQAILFRQELFQERGGFDEALDQLEDWHLWKRYGYRNSFAYVPTETSLFRTPASPEARREREMKFSGSHIEAMQRAKKAIQAIDTEHADANPKRASV